MARNYVAPGDVLELVAPQGGVVSGGGYIVGELFVIALGDADAGEFFRGQRVGVWELPKDEGEEWDQGVPLYWSDGELTAEGDGESVMVGYSTTAAANPSRLGRVLLVTAVNRVIEVEAEGT